MKQQERMRSWNRGAEGEIYFGVLTKTCPKETKEEEYPGGVEGFFTK